MATGLYEHIVERAERSSERVSISRPGREDISYHALVAATERMAGLLAARGLRAGDRVCVQVDKSVDALLLYLASLRQGTIFVPLNTACTAREIDYFLSDARPALFVCRPSDVEALRGVAASNGCGIATLGDEREGSLLAGRDDVAIPPAARPASEDIAAILYTSGTTGRSKGAMLSNGNLLSNALALIDAWGIVAEDRLLHVLPIFHAHGLFVGINTILLAGAEMLFLDRFDAGEAIAALPGVSLLMGVPTHYSRLLGDPAFGPAQARTIRLFISGSAPLSAETHKLFEARTGHVILERYGMTETGMIASNPLKGERRPGSVGLALPGVSVRIADLETEDILEAGVRGVVEVSGPNVFSGYWRNPEKTAADFRPDGYFVTGDLGHIDAAGYLTLVGRSKDLVITGGYNVYPAEVEGVLDCFPGVTESAVIGVPHPDFGEAIVAVVATPPEEPAFDHDAAILFLRERLANYKLPKAIVAVRELPRNVMGKVQKASLREQYKSLLRC